MAFNPFHRFRKHQKVVFAGLTIICMLTFVLTSGVSGGGDFFSELQRMIGVRSRAAEAAGLFGKPVDRPELTRLREQRLLANRFMALSQEQAFRNILQDVERSVPDFDVSLKSQLQQIFQSRAMAAQMAALGFPQGDYYQRQLLGYLNQLEALVERLRAEKKSTDADKIAALRDMLQKDILRTQHRDDLYPGAELYFGGSISVDGLLDFLIWRRQADELGIYLSPDDVKREFSRETMKLLTGEQTSEIQSMLRLGHGDTPRLLEALGEEFRVRLAQAALIGYDSSGIIQTPAPVTPYELWQYYERNRTEASVDVLPVPVEVFVTKVKPPTEEELVSLFEKYKDVEFSPEKDTPGFKLPERIAVQWIGASPAAPHYRAAAENIIRAFIAQIPSNPLPAIALYAQLNEKYSDAFQDFQNEKWNFYKVPGWTEADFRPAFYTYKSLHRPETVASLVGKLAGGVSRAASGPAKAVSLLPALTSFQGSALAREEKDLHAIMAQEAERGIPAVAGLFGAGTTADPALAAAGIWDYLSTLHQHLPLSTVQADILRKVEDGLTGHLVTESLDSFKRELEALKKDQEEFVKKTSARYGWSQGASKGLNDRFNIAEDVGLRPLAEAYLGKDRLQDFRSAQQFANIFFTDRGDQKSRLFKPETLPAGSAGSEERTNYLFWRTAEKKPEVITFAEARKRVEEAWRIEQSRKLASEEAEKIAAQARGAGGDAIRNLTDAAKQLGQQVFRLDAVARLKASPLARAGLGSQYEAYKVPEDKLRYPTSDFIDRILDDLTVKGDVIVLSDRPGRHYYVIALAQREPASMKEFRQGSLLGQLAQERRAKYREQIRDALREQAGFWVSDDFRKDFDDRRGGLD
jgi:hypothetical protein